MVYAILFKKNNQTKTYVANVIYKINTNSYSAF